MDPHQLSQAPYARPLLDSEIQALTSEASPRDRALIWLCLGAGLRAQEAAGVRVQHLNSDGSLTVPSTTAKGKHPRLVYLSTQAHTILLQWLATLEDRSPEAPMFPSRKRKHGQLQCLQPGTVVDLVKDLMVQAGITGASSHSLRRTHATRLRDTTDADLVLIKAQLGHSSLVVTERYLEVTPARHREIVRELKLGWS